MKITTWNINGYRAITGKGFFEWLMDAQPDVLCLQEIKTKPEQLKPEQLEVPGYEIVWNPAQRPGYSGVATFFKKSPDTIKFGLGLEKFDVEGRVIQSKQAGFTLFNIYFPNGQRGKDRVDYKLEFYDELLKIYKELVAQGEHVVITGDFNTAHHEIDLANPKQNMDTSGFLPEEREKVDEYVSNGMIDIFRHLYPEKVQYTWWTYITNARARNVGWRLDYYMISPDFQNRVVDVQIHDDVMGSDHCPVSMILKE